MPSVELPSVIVARCARFLVVKAYASFGSEAFIAILLYGVQPQVVLGVVGYQRHNACSGLVAVANMQVGCACFGGPFVVREVPLQLVLERG